MPLRAVSFTREDLPDSPKSGDLGSEDLCKIQLGEPLVNVYIALENPPFLGFFDRYTGINYFNGPFSMANCESLPEGNSGFSPRLSEEEPLAEAAEARQDLSTLKVGP